MQAFIVRPFGTRKVMKKDANDTSSAVDFDFERVHNELIAPALQRADLSGGTTGLIFEAGSIHEDMFSLLLTADIVVADISIHNANVFYELGIRHALRDKRTVLIKCEGFEDTPFDILGYRYIAYTKDEPATSLDDFVKALKDTMQADRPDSPVFSKLPKLETQDPEAYIAIPNDFEQELQLSITKGDATRLSMMAAEVEGFSWYIPAQRKLGEALFSLRCLDPARAVWEKVIQYNQSDLQANERLATIYQRLAELVITDDLNESKALLEQSDAAIESLLSSGKVLTPWKRAEAYALKARNAKTMWMTAWKDAPDAERASAALSSDYLQSAMEAYEKGFLECLNHYYSGINAYGLLLTAITLADKYPDVWQLYFDTPDLALQKLAALKERQKRLQQAVALSIEAGKQTTDKDSDDFAWLKITEADFICLTDSRPARVRLMYENALKEASTLNLDATVRQLLIYQQLGIFAENIQAALQALPPVTFGVGKIKTHMLLFTGHMIDRPGRPDQRFPPEKEKVVKDVIKEKVQKEQETAGGNLVGIAGGASGGDILFHEACAELGIKTQLYLALPHDMYVAESVAFAGPDWVDRFNALYSKLPWQVLAQKKELPDWLKSKEHFTIWERNNLWMLYKALENGGLNMSLIALWNGKGGDGQGGTSHMVREAKSRGAKTIVINIEEIK